jgi:ribosomal-protein-alanine N-acetyltransferase
MDIISSARLDLVSLPASFLEASLAGDAEEVEQWLDIPVPSDWLENRWLMQYRLEQLRSDPTVQPWLLRAMVLREERVMVGHIGFHTPPRANYLQEYAPDGVEIGYTVYPPFRQRGYATEACTALMAWATQQQPGVRFVVSISPNNVPSLRIAHHADICTYY